MENLVTVVTRTCNRLPLLERAAQSIVDQEQPDLVWSIINNGGERTGVEAIGDWARRQGVATRIEHLATPQGIWFAGNAGVKSSNSRYLILHDDDDSWSKCFLKKTIEHLEAHPEFAGVATQCMCIHEHINIKEIEEIRRFVLNADFQACQLADMVVHNRIVPIAFLYRSDLHKKVGWFREDLPVMGDWEFSLRVLAKFNISVLPEPLANYHQRVEISDENNPYGNTVVARSHQHAMVDAMIRNELLRKDWERGVTGIGTLMADVRSKMRVAELERFSLDAVQGRISTAVSDQAAEFARMHKIQSQHEIEMIEESSKKIEQLQDALSDLKESLSKSNGEKDFLYENMNDYRESLKKDRLIWITELSRIQNDVANLQNESRKIVDHLLKIEARSIRRFLSRLMRNRDRVASHDTNQTSST